MSDFAPMYGLNPNGSPSAIQLDSSGNLKIAGLTSPGSALASWISQPTQTAAGAADTLLKFGSGGTSQANHASLQNNNTINIYYSFDVDSTASTSAVYILSPGQQVFLDRAFFVLHCHTASQIAINGLSGFTVEAFA